MSMIKDITAKVNEVSKILQKRKDERTYDDNGNRIPEPGEAVYLAWPTKEIKLIKKEDDSNV